ncbi:hypothetical protein [Acidisphaera sp. S103]|uniref:hypothetical protein n=1 Tax=Acidisphaera sp. S103 TaxID=1747223 RepID=UPI00131D0873|nr:hypothetical protein [Acidisphaera sp. S103]
MRLFPNPENSHVVAHVMQPIAMLRTALEVLDSAGTKGFASMIPDLIIPESVPKGAQLDLKLWHMTLAEPICVAHALRARVLTPIDGAKLWMALGNHQADFMNLHRTLALGVPQTNTANSSFVSTVLPPIGIFRFNRPCSLDEVTDLESARIKGRGLYFHLLACDPSIRDEKIERYHTEIRKRADRQIGRISFDTSTIALQMAKFVSSAILPQLRLPSSGALKIVLEKLRQRFATIDRFANVWESGVLAGPENIEAHLNFLERISAIAHLEIDEKE